MMQMLMRMCRRGPGLHSQRRDAGEPGHDAGRRRSCGRQAQQGRAGAGLHPARRQAHQVRMFAQDQTLYIILLVSKMSSELVYKQPGMLRPIGRWRWVLQLPWRGRPGQTGCHRPPPMTPSAASSGQTAQTSTAFSSSQNAALVRSLALHLSADTAVQDSCMPGEPLPDANA